MYCKLYNTLPEYHTAQILEAAVRGDCILSVNLDIFNFLQLALFRWGVSS